MLVFSFSFSLLKQKVAINCNYTDFERKKRICISISRVLHVRSHVVSKSKVYFPKCLFIRWDFPNTKDFTKQLPKFPKNSPENACLSYTSCFVCSSNEEDPPKVEQSCSTVKHMSAISRCGTEPGADYLARYMETEDTVTYGM